MWFCCSQNLELCVMKTRNIEGTCFSMFSNICTHRMSPRTWECSTDEKLIVVHDKCLKKGLMTFFKRWWVTPWWPDGSSGGGSGCPRTVADRAQWGYLASHHSIGYAYSSELVSRGHAHVVYYYNNKGDHQFSDVDEICPESNSQENKTFNPKVRQGF